MSCRHVAVGGLRVPPAEVNRVLVLGAALNIVAAPDLTLVLHCRFLDGETLIYLDLGHVQLLLSALLDLRRLLHLQLPLDDLMRKEVLHGHRRLFGRGLCHGKVTADVLAEGLSREANACMW